MSESTDCSVCTEAFTTVVRTKITCLQCSYSACKTCVSRYLLSQVADAHCMNCRTGWNREFLDQNMTKAFRTGPWRDHRKKMIVIREKALLPNFQVYATAKKNIDRLLPIVTKVMKEEIDYTTVLNKINTSIYSVKAQMIRDPSKDEEYTAQLNKYILQQSEQIFTTALAGVKAARINNEYEHHLMIYNGSAKKEVEKREFIMKCVKEGCRGFLSQAYKCELCSTYVCKDCMVVKKDRDDAQHVCKKDDIDTVAMIRKDTRPCPKCGIRISKIDGCDQMWCTADGCGTAFSWNSGKIISGVIHNPHYYEWVRNNNNGVAPRNIGDIPCGGLPLLHIFMTAARTIGMSTTYITNNNNNSIYTKISTIHRCLTDLEFVRVPHYNVTRDENLLKEVHVDYLLGIIDEAKWTQSIYLKETNLEKKQAIAQVLNTFMNAGADMMRTLHTILTQMQRDKLANNQYKLNDETLKPVKDILNQIDNLRIYINETLERLAETIVTPVPQFDKLFNWQPAASSDRIKAQRKEAEKEASKAGLTT
jgi:hypothetical protein